MYTKFSHKSQKHLSLSSCWKLNILISQCNGIEGEELAHRPIREEIVKCRDLFGVLHHVG